MSAQQRASLDYSKFDIVDSDEEPAAKRAAPAVAKWPCVACSFENEPDELSCTMCDTLNPAVEAMLG